MRSWGPSRAATVFLAVSGSLATACAPIYMPGGQLPTVEPLRLASAGRPSGTLRLSSLELREPIERATKDSGVFGAFVIEPTEARASSTDYTITIEIRTDLRRPTGGEVAYTITAAVTLGILPYFRHADLTLTATLADRSGQNLKTYTFQDSIREVQQVVIMFVPVGVILTPEHAAARVIENMMRHLYRQIEADRLLVPPAPTS